MMSPMTDSLAIYPEQEPVEEQIIGLDQEILREISLRLDSLDQRIHHVETSFHNNISNASKHQAATDQDTNTHNNEERSKELKSHRSSSQKEKFKKLMEVNAALM